MADCVTCGGLLVGRQKKYCSDPECKKLAPREAHLLKTYGISLEDWDVIWEYQGRKCAICGREPKIKPDGTEEVFHLDHEHAKGQSGPIRGIVCPYDNTRTIGRLKSHERAQRLADYLREPPATKALGRTVIAPGRPPKKRTPRKRKK
ncbi:endonuclease domain-containing protein [Micromonospora sp. CB01531]|uniref:endonuclease domain-containing protein n=1 Tax=Micromonospora sp. CB01531 TaxID=1718947 RepID=UPI00093F43ED|nr:endonuclease domain-containing protein [Micromonospora sp. CB01531]